MGGKNSRHNTCISASMLGRGKVGTDSILLYQNRFESTKVTAILLGSFKQSYVRVSRIESAFKVKASSNIRNSSRPLNIDLVFCPQKDNLQLHRHSLGWCVSKHCRIPTPSNSSHPNGIFCSLPIDFQPEIFQVRLCYYNVSERSGNMAVSLIEERGNFSSIYLTVLKQSKSSETVSISFFHQAP